VELPVLDGRFDLVVAAHLLGELFVDRPPEHRVAQRARCVRAWVGELLSAGGTMILVEPALRDTSRELLAVRDQLLALSDLGIVATCIWGGPCPARAHGGDWCHDAATTTVGPWEGPTPPATGSRGETPRSPTRFAQRGSRVDFSYLVLREA